MGGAQLLLAHNPSRSPTASAGPAPVSAVWRNRQQARRRERAVRRRQRDAETGTIVWHEPDPEEARRRERAHRRRQRLTVAGSFAWVLVGVLVVFMDEPYMLWVGLGLILWGVTNAVVTLRMISRETPDEPGAHRDGDDT